MDLIKALAVTSFENSSSTKQLLESIVKQVQRQDDYIAQYQQENDRLLDEMENSKRSSSLERFSYALDFSWGAESIR